MHLTAETLQLGLAWYVVFLFSLTLHEAAHAFAALRLGDPTAYHGGQVTLNPLPHMLREPLGTILVPILTFAFSGWMMGWASAPYDPYWAGRHPRRAGLMALAGPVSNLLLVVLAGLAMRVGLGSGTFVPPPNLGFASVVAASGDGAINGVAVVLSITFSLNLVLFLFNLLPLPPLDGSAIIQLVLPDDIARRYQNFMAEPMFALLGLVIAWRFFPYLFGPVYRASLGVLYPGLL